MSGDKAKEITPSEKIVNSLDGLIDGLRLEIDRAQSIKNKYLGVEPQEPEKTDVKEMSPNGHVETVNRKLMILAGQIIKLNHILTDVDNSL